MTGEELLALLESPDYKARMDAFDRVAASQSREYLPILATLAEPRKPQIELLFTKYLQNVSPDDALPALRNLLDSPNKGTRKSAARTIAGFNILFTLATLMDLFSAAHKDVVLFALEQLALYRKAVAIDEISHLLESPDKEVFEAAFKAMRLIDARRSVANLLPHVLSTDPDRAIAAMNTLGKMSVFHEWKSFLPNLSSSAADVRKSAVINLVRVGRGRANQHILPLLSMETDDEVTKIAINRLAIHPDAKAAHALVLAAATHSSPQVRRAAGWVIDELDEALLKKTLVHHLAEGSEEIVAYALVKLAQRELPECGAAIAPYASRDRSPRIRLAAIEALGFLRDASFLPVVTPWIGSENAIEAYVATLAAAQITRRLDECPELASLLISRDEKNYVLQQVILQYMSESLNWKYEDKQLTEVLRQNLASENQNVRYLSAILLGKSGYPVFVADLSNLAFNDPDGAVRQIARESMEALVRGDMTFFLDQIERESGLTEFNERVLNLIASLEWDFGSAERAIDVFQGIRANERYPDIYKALETIAGKVIAAVPDEVRLHFRTEISSGPWRFLLGRAWLQHMKELKTSVEREDWRLLLKESNGQLVKEVVGKAISVSASWAAQDIIDRIDEGADDDLNIHLRTAVRELLSM